MNTRKPSGSNRRGQSLIEFTFVGIPMIFVLISIFEISRGMWMYHTLAYAVKEGVRFAIVHGQNCDPAFGGNNCRVNLGPATTVGTVSWVIRQAGVGLDPKATTLTFTAPGNATTTCTLDASTTPCPASFWPLSPGNGVGQTIRIDIATPFRSAIAMLWPGSKPISFAVGVFGASSSDYVQF
jgi:Flp pilus assembly protein TadG